MDSFHQKPGFCYDDGSHSMTDADGFTGLLDIYVHHARNIHNICIYDNQDVYAKFSLTCSPDEALSTSIVNGGGKNPVFNEGLRMKITQIDAVLKCEIWMLSRARNFLEDQLLGFALVPLSTLAGQGKLTQDFTLSSTDLFHSPAGTVKLSLFLVTSESSDIASSRFSQSTISSEVVLLDRKGSEAADPVDQYGRIEFPDINIVTENHKMVTQYFNMAERNSASKTGIEGAASFLHLGASQSAEDYDMAANSSEDNCGGSVSPNDSVQHSGVFSSTTTSLSDDRNTGDSMDKKNHGILDSSSSASEPHQSSETSPETPTSKNGSLLRDKTSDSDYTGKGEDGDKQAKLGSVFTAPLANINLEAEQKVMQQKIVDMYMRSMQQFTESLAKMKLPMDLDKPENNDDGRVIQGPGNKMATEKKDGSRVFYGSRAFF
ncbi:hypothetical protein H6P81_002539 [Aristolochia fimbriata]|uniref:C2 domain-containing protein n=1 Tax=Aristolochia fimbriata TaxID=158543 RepID=A0AAV7FB83_ARIFI|nr:hypothetical protein H6P81_002539 [Aristolochia fimbriata]